MSPMQPMAERVTIFGLGLFGGGEGAARYFAERGATVTVTDRRDATELAESLAALAGLPIEYHLGGHPDSDFTDADRVIVNPGVPPDAPALALARRSGARLDTEINLLFTLCPAPIAAVTGTNGKSTTTALLGDMMRATGRHTWVGGNLGGSLLPEVEGIAPDDIVVLEISSFQAQRLAWVRRSPHLAVVLNITPNHLDRHPNLADYIAAKQELLRYQRPEDLAVLNADDPVLRTWSDAGQGEKVFVGAGPQVGAQHAVPVRARLDGPSVRLRRGRNEEKISLVGLRLPGPHNRFDAACAATAARLLGADALAIAQAVAQFKGLPDRMEFVAEKGGVRFYNDSLATNPESAMAALDALGERVILIAGGSSKKLCFGELGQRIARRAKAVLLLGATAGEIEAAIRQAGDAVPPLHRAATLGAAVESAARIAEAGDVVLLSPACASYDMFRNYAERGQVFREAVHALPTHH